MKKYLVFIAIIVALNYVQLSRIEKKIDSFSSPFEASPSALGTGLDNQGTGLPLSSSQKRSLSQACPYSFEDLLDAIEWVESKGDANTVGSKGEVGVFQLSKIYVDDVNRIGLLTHKDKYLRPIQWNYYHREDPYSSRWIVKMYLEHYAIKERLGHEPILEDMARIHNGGPNGWEKDCTKPYWEKVRKRLGAGGK